MLITTGAVAIFCSGGILIFNEGFVSIWIGVQYYQGTVVITALALSFLFVVIGNSWGLTVFISRSLQLCCVFAANADLSLYRVFGIFWYAIWDTWAIFAMPLSWVSAIYFSRKTEDIKYLSIDRFSSKIILISMINIIITCVIIFLFMETQFVQYPRLF